MASSKQMEIEEARLNSEEVRARNQLEQLKRQRQFMIEGSVLAQIERGGVRFPADGPVPKRWMRQLIAKLQEWFPADEAE